MSIDRSPDGGNGREDPEETMLAGLRREVEDIRQEHTDVMARHAEVEHLAGLSAHAIAQELIDRFGAVKVLDAIAQIRREGKEYFIDLICALLPAVCSRRAFCARILQNLESRRSAQRPDSSDDALKERYLRFCLFYDRYPIACIPVLNRLHRRSCKQKLAHAQDGSLVAHLHLSSLPQDFHPERYRDVLAASGNNLAALQRAEMERMSNALVRIEERCQGVRSTVQDVISGQRSETERDWQSQIEALEQDLAVLEGTVASLQSPAAKKIQSMAVERMRIALGDALQIRDEEVHARCAPFNDLLRSLPAPPIHLAEQNGTASRVKKNGSGNGSTPPPEA